MIKCISYFDNMNHFGVAHESHKQTDRQTNGQVALAIAPSNSWTHAIKTLFRQHSDNGNVWTN